MIDLYLLREKPQQVADILLRRGFSFDVSLYSQLEEKRKVLQVETQTLQNERNLRSKEIGIVKSQGQDIRPLLEKIQHLGEKLDEKKNQLGNILSDIEGIIQALPNLPHESVPLGKDERDNVEIRRVGQVPIFDFAVRSHDELGENMGWMDFELSAKITGSRFVVMKSSLAKLHRAIGQFMLDTHSREHGYEEVYVPYIVNKDSLYGTGQLPKFESDLFKIMGDDGYYLTSTAEIPVTNMVRDCILDEKQLPLKFVCHSPCFRSEAGSYGKDTKGMIRQHQFEKVELVWITKPQDSYQALEQLVTHAEAILQRLNLAYRVVTLCTGDMGATAAKTYDIEVWIPSQNAYREISSCSNTEAFQARRMHARYRDLVSRDTELVHTLNGSGLAIGRTLVAIMENYQQADGSILVPEALIPYMNGLSVIEAPHTGFKSTENV